MSQDHSACCARGSAGRDAIDRSIRSRPPGKRGRPLLRVRGAGRLDCRGWGARCPVCCCGRQMGDRRGSTWKIVSYRPIHAVATRSWYNRFIRRAMGRAGGPSVKRSSAQCTPRRSIPRGKLWRGGPVKCQEYACDKGGSYNTSTERATCEELDREERRCVRFAFLNRFSNV